MFSHLGFSVGDYVIADHAKFDSFEGVTFKITELTANSLGDPLIKVVDVTRPDDAGTSFYPSELSYEDGTRPGHVVNRGAW